MKSLLNIETFVLVVNEGSFSAAARLLDTTPSAVSRQIAQLETELDARLFQRTTRRQTLTEAGHVYYQYAQSIVADLQSAKTAVQKITTRPSGKLTVSAEADFANVFIAPILPAFMTHYPDIDVRLVLSSHLEDLVDKQVDVAIRLGQLADSGLIAKPLGVSQSVVCASPAYLKQQSTPSHPSDLVNHQCLSFKLGLGKSTWSFVNSESSHNQTINVAVSARLQANSLSLLKQQALHHQGVILVPKWLVRDELADGTLEALLPHYPVSPTDNPITAVFNHREFMPPKLRCFLDFLTEHGELNPP